jgi:hypothetical protein
LRELPAYLLTSFFGNLESRRATRFSSTERKAGTAAPVPGQTELRAGKAEVAEERGSLRE